MDFLCRQYTYVFEELSDPRVKGWSMIDSPIPVLSILLTYFALIKVILPKYMKNRSPYNLKTIIRWYNVFQIITNGVLFYGILTSGWLTTLGLGCHLPSFEAVDPESMRLLYWMYWTAMFRLTDFAETIFFILRKKNSQASFLHIYHHVISASLMWVGVKYFGGGSGSLAMLINTPIHVIMYTYYLVSSEAGPTLRAKMSKWKVWLTNMQMLQFTILFIHSLQGFLPSCPAPRVIFYLYMPNVLIIFYLFYDFYKKTYWSPKTPSKLKPSTSNGEVFKNGNATTNKRKVI